MKGFFLIIIFFLGLFLGDYYEKPIQVLYSQTFEKGSKDDPRWQAISRFLSTHDSKLAIWKKEIIIISDQYNVDPYLIIGIGMVESTLCKYDFGSNNCFGIGGSSNFMVFSSLSESINFLARLLSKEKVYEKYRETQSLTILGSIYCGKKCLGWANQVGTTMETLKVFEEDYKKERRKNIDIPEWL